MTVPHAWVLCYVREKDELRQQEKVLQFFQKLAQHNCLLSSTLEIGTAAIWRRFVVEAPGDEELTDEQASFAFALQPGVSEYVEHETRVYVAECQEQLTVEARLIARSKLLRGFEFAVTLAPDDGAIIFSVDHERFFHRGEAGVLKFRYWTKLLQEVYAYWHPLFMHEFTHQGPPSLNPTWEDARALRIPALYTLNIFSPELVKQLGQEKLEQAPAWIMETLRDGGVLLIPEDIYGLLPDLSHSLASVARHLGFPVEELEESTTEG